MVLMNIFGRMPDNRTCKIFSALRRRKGQVNYMEDGRKKIWICILVIVLAAVAAGILYYLSTADVPDDEGFLIRAPYTYSSAGGNDYAV